MTTLQRIGILTSGGDAPGMNAAVRAATLVARAAGVDVVGIERGYRGLLEDAVVPLTATEVGSILREGGTMLGSARCKEFHERPVRDRARAILRARGIDGLVVIGGNGSLTGAQALADPDEAGPDAPRVVGIPASIDNDLGLTGLSIGVDTAMNTIVEACDKIADTATAHDRTFIIEVMGRDCGYLAMTSAIAAGADLALFPEAGRSEAAIVDSIVDTVLAVRQRARRSRRVIIIKAEGVAIAIDRLKSLVDARLCERVPGTDPSSIETRVTVLGHVVRGGRPSAFDRLLGSRLANVAVRGLLAGATQKMAAWMPPIDLPEEIGTRSPADPYCWLVDLGAVLAETDNLLRGRSPLARWRAGAFDDIEDALLL
ncbi:MAG: 6-phosphofructokinase [Myxococcales bacterium]|nr:6-phosphofructokinase [Myxococcales bacterium]